MRRARRPALPMYAGFSLAAALGLAALALADPQGVTHLGTTIQSTAASALQDITQR
jgi:hypothetical protein